MRFSLRNVAVLLLVSLFAAVFAFGQAEQGTITGVVTDPSGAVVAGATVTATNTATGYKRTATSSGNGAYFLAALPPAVYDITVEKSGFAPFKTQVKVNVGGRQTIDASLTAAGGTTTIEVSGEAGIEVNTVNGEQSQVITDAQIQSLPNISRNPYALAVSAGNVGQNLEFGLGDRGVGVTINGQRASSVDILLDGAENTDLFGVGVGMQTPLDSTQEFRIVTNGLGAEYGRASGGIVNVATKSGTNSFHGSAYEFWRGSNLASREFDDAVRGLEKSRFNRNNFGFSIGGPVVKDKLFFFNNTEWLRIRSNANRQRLVLNPAIIAASNSATQAFFTTYGTRKPDLVTTQTFTVAQVIAGSSGTFAASNPNFAALPGTTPVFDLVSYRVPANAGGGTPENNYNSVSRVDFNLTDRTTMFGRYSVIKDDFFAGSNNSSPYVGFDTGSQQFNNQALLSVTHTFTPAVVNTTKLQFSRFNNLQPLDPKTGVVPTLYFRADTAYSFGGKAVANPGYSATSPGNAIPFGGPQNFGEIANDLNWNKGNHNIKIGGQYLYIKDNRVFGAYEEAVAALSAAGVGKSFDRLLAGQLGLFQVAVDPQGKLPCHTSETSSALIPTPDCTLNLPLNQPRFDRANRFHDAALYVQDNWKVTSRVTLNLGLRWEYYGVQHNNNPNFDSNFYFGSGNTIQERIRNGQVLTTPNAPDKGLWAPQYKNFAPRLGFAWDVFGNGKTAVRGSYAINYERNFGNVTFNVIQNPPAYAVISLQAGVDVPTIALTNSNLGPFAGSGITKLFPNSTLRNPDQNMKTAYANAWGFSVDQEVAKNTTLSLGYNGSHGVHQYSLSNFNRAGSGHVYLGYPRASSRMNLQFSNANSRGSNGDNYYNGLNVGFRTANLFNWGISATANYTWSHAIDNTSSTFTDYSANNNNLGFLDPFNPKLDNGDADYDARHRLSTTILWDLPFGKNSGRAVKAIVGGWSFAPVFSASTGNPFSVFDCSLTAFAVCPRAIFDKAPAHSGTGSYTVDDANNFNYLTLPGYSTTSTGSYGQYSSPNDAFGTGEFPTCSTPGVFSGGAVTQVASGCTWPSTMSRRNAFRGPNNWNLDFGAFKTFDITERVKMRLSAEVSNILNHHNMFITGNGTNDVSFAVLPGTRCSDTACTTTVTDPNAPATDTIPYIQAYKSGRRHMQLGIRFTF